MIKTPKDAEAAILREHIAQEEPEEAGSPNNTPATSLKEDDTAADGADGNDMVADNVSSVDQVQHDDWDQKVEDGGIQFSG